MAPVELIVRQVKCASRLAAHRAARGLCVVISNLVSIPISVPVVVLVVVLVVVVVGKTLWFCPRDEPLRLINIDGRVHCCWLVGCSHAARRQREHQDGRCGNVDGTGGGGGGADDVTRSTSKVNCFSWFCSHKHTHSQSVVFAGP